MTDHDHSSDGDDEPAPGGSGVEESEASKSEDGDQPPETVVDEAERLTRRARAAVDDAEATAYRDRRDGLLAEYEFRARIREDDDGDVLAMYPAEWVVDGTVEMDRVNDVSRGIERSLSGPGEADEWAAVEAHNRDLAEEVAEDDEAHGANAHALADFASNHYAKRIERLTGPELKEFRNEYYPRNAWPSDAQRDCLEDSIRRVFAAADAPVPEAGLEE